MAIPGTTAFMDAARSGVGFVGRKANYASQVASIASIGHPRIIAAGNRIGHSATNFGNHVNTYKRGYGALAGAGAIGGGAGYAAGRRGRNNG